MIDGKASAVVLDLSAREVLICNYSVKCKS